MDPPPHPDLAMLDWDELATEHADWIALARVLDLAAGSHAGLTLCAMCEDYTLTELSDMARAGISLAYKALPCVDYTRRTAALIAVSAAVDAINAIVLDGAQRFEEARQRARTEAYGFPATPPRQDASHES